MMRSGCYFHFRSLSFHPPATLKVSLQTLPELEPLSDHPPHCSTAVKKSVFIYCKPFNFHHLISLEISNKRTKDFISHLVRADQ